MRRSEARQRCFLTRRLSECLTQTAKAEAQTGRQCISGWHGRSNRSSLAPSGSVPELGRHRIRATGNERTSFFHQNLRNRLLRNVNVFQEVLSPSDHIAIYEPLSKGPVVSIGRLCSRDGIRV